MSRFIACHFERANARWTALCGTSSDNVVSTADAVTCRRCQRILAKRSDS